MPTQHKKRLTVIVTRKLPDIIETRLMELFDCHLNLDDHKMTSEELRSAMQNCDVLVPTVTDKLDSQLLQSAAPRLRLIASFGTGVDHIDILAARRRDILVSNTPNVLTEDTADMTMALIVAISRRLSEGERLIRSGRWQGWAPTLMLGHRIWGKRLGIIGMGQIGCALAQRARGFGISIHYHNRKPVSDAVADRLEATYWPSLGQMLAHVDIVSVNCPHTPATYHLLNERRLGLCRPHVYIINTSRGEVIDEAALYIALKRQVIAGAALDVFENEPEINPALLKLDNVFLLPHMGSATIEGRIDMGDRVLLNIRSFYDGHSPPDLVVDIPF